MWIEQNPWKWSCFTFILGFLLTALSLNNIFCSFYKTTTVVLEITSKDGKSISGIEDVFFPGQGKAITVDGRVYSIDVKTRVPRFKILGCQSCEINAIFPYEITYKKETFRDTIASNSDYLEDTINRDKHLKP